MTIDPVTVALAKQFEPILLFHEDEKFLPIDPKFYLERCALWKSVPPSSNKADWGDPSVSPFPRRPQLDKGEIAARADETDGGRTWIGKPDFLVIPEPEGERKPTEDRFLQLVGWEPIVLAPDEVTNTSANRHPTLVASFYDAALMGGKPWYYAEYFNHQQLLALAGQHSDNGIDLFNVANDSRLNSPAMLVYHFFYAFHDEPLRGCTKPEGQLFSSFAGEWASIALLINSANQVLFVGTTTRNVGDPMSANAAENRIGMLVHKRADVDFIGTHPKIFISLGTHGNYVTPGSHQLTPFTPGDIDLSQGTCGEIETLDDVIPDPDEPPIPGTDPSAGDITIFVLKCITIIGAFFVATENLLGSFSGESPPLTPDKQPVDQTGGPLFGRIIKPKGVFVPEQASAQQTEEWVTEMPADGAKPRYDFIVDRSEQVWWPPRDKSVGYAGRWGPRVTNDPKLRRSGMRCPAFGRMFLEAIGRL